MKIGIITEYYYPLLGGITEHVHHFSQEAKKLGHEPVIITGYAGKDPYNSNGDVELIHVGRSLPIYSNESIARVAAGFNVGRRLKEIFKSKQFDIIHIHSPLVPTLPILAQRHSNTTTVGTFHSQFDKSNLMKVFHGWLKNYFDKLHGRIAVSDLCISSVGKYFQGDYEIIPNGVDIEKFNSNVEKVEKFNDGKTNIFFLSRLEPRNGLEYLIRAFIDIRKKRDDCRLIIGGDGPMSNYYKSIIPSEIKEDVHFLGRIDGSRPNYYATADIFCFPTTKASFGITLLEAMAASKPVLAFSLPAYENILKSGDEGLLCGDINKENFRDGLEKLLDSPEERLRIGRNARLKAEDYSWTKVTHRIIDYYEKIKG